MNDPAKEAVVGAIVMIGTLFGLIALIAALVRYFDPEARGAGAPAGHR